MFRLFPVAFFRALIFIDSTIEGQKMYFFLFNTDLGSLKLIVQVMPLLEIATLVYKLLWPYKYSLLL